MLLQLDTNRNSYLGSPTAPLNLTLGDLHRSNSMSLKFCSFLPRKGADLGRILLKHQ